MWDFGFIEAALTTTELERVPFLKDELVVAGKKEETLWLVREKGSASIILRWIISTHTIFSHNKK